MPVADRRFFIFVTIAVWGLIATALVVAASLPV